MDNFKINKEEEIMRKISLLLVLILVVSAFMVGCGGSGGDSSDAKVIKIGIFEPLTGENGGGGAQELDGMKYANTVRPTVDIDGVEYKVEPVSYTHLRA